MKSLLHSRLAVVSLALVISLGLTTTGCSETGTTSSLPQAPAQQESKAVGPAAKVNEKVEEKAVKSSPMKDEAVIPAAATTEVPVTDMAAVKVSSFAPAENLVKEMDRYLKDFGKAVASEEEYKDGASKIEKDANTVIVVCLALGLHDQDNQYKKNASAMLAAAKKLAETKDYAATKQAVEAFAAAAKDQNAAGPELKWEKVASLEQLMKAVPLINTKLKRNVAGKRFKTKAAETAGYTAVIAAIGHASIADTSEAKDAAQVEQWKAFSAKMRDEAGALNRAIREKDQKAADEILPKLALSCDECHAVFHPTATPAGDDK